MCDQEKCKSMSRVLSESQDCPLVLLAQTCSKIKLTASTDFKLNRSSAFQLQSSRMDGGLVKIAPAPKGCFLVQPLMKTRVCLTPPNAPGFAANVKSKMMTACKTKLLPKNWHDQNLRLASMLVSGLGLPLGMCSGSQGSEKILGHYQTAENITCIKRRYTDLLTDSDDQCTKGLTQPNKTEKKNFGVCHNILKDCDSETSGIQSTTIKPIQPCQTATSSVTRTSAEQFSTRRSQPAGLRSVSSHLPADSMCLSSQSMQKNSRNDFHCKLRGLPDVVLLPGQVSENVLILVPDIMPPEAITKQMLKVVHPPQCQERAGVAELRSRTCQVKILQDTENELCDGIVQISIPPDMSPSMPQQILRLATQTAKRHHMRGKEGKASTVHNPGTKQCKKVAHSEIVRRKAVENTAGEIVSRSVGSTLVPVRKSRTRCECANCTSTRSTSCLTDTSKKRLHVCRFAGCEKQFGKTSHLRAHVRSHTGERPYICSFPFCDRKFTRSDDLLRHHRTHGGFKKFVCCFCQKRFMRSDHLNKHRRIHLRK